MVNSELHWVLTRVYDQEQLASSLRCVELMQHKSASQQKLNQGSKACVIKNSLKYLLIHFLICNFSLPCTPFENLS